MKDLLLFLAVLGRINPAIFDALFPHGPAQAAGIRRLQSRAAAGRYSPADLVSLNPQPIPPGHELQFAAVDVANHIARAAIVAETTGQDVGAMVGDWIDDWCGNGRKPFPWPWPWPPPWPIVDPEPNPDWDVPASQVAGALALAAVASRLDEGPARAALGMGAEQLMNAGLGV